MKAIPLLIVLGLLLPRQSEEEKALDVFKTFVLRLKNDDLAKAVDCIHPKSLVKLKGSVLRRFGFEKPEELATRLKSLGYATWEEAEKAEPRDVYVRHMKRMMDGYLHIDTMARTVEGIVGTLKKDGKVYIVAETKYAIDGGAPRDQAVLYVAYKDGEQWKLATHGESDIGE